MQIHICRTYTMFAFIISQAISLKKNLFYKLYDLFMMNMRTSSKYKTHKNMAPTSLIFSKVIKM